MRISDWSSDVCSSDLLLLVAVMAVLVMSVLDDIRFGLRRASNAQSMAQAQWYARGAETLAMAQIDRLASPTPGRTTLAGDWNGRPVVFPVEHGTLSATLSAARGCFTLSRVVECAPELSHGSDAGSPQFARLPHRPDRPAPRGTSTG